MAPPLNFAHELSGFFTRLFSIPDTVYVEPHLQKNGIPITPISHNPLPANLFKIPSIMVPGVPMKIIIPCILFLFTASTVAAGFVPRVAIQHPQQARVFLYPPICENMVLPSLPNRGVIYAQVYTHDANVLYIEFNGNPITDELGNIIYYPKVDPEQLEIIPIYIEEQYKASIIMARAVNDYGANTVYAVFIPIPTGTGYTTTAFGCATMY